MKILPIFVLLACVAWQASAQDEKTQATRGLLKRGQNTQRKVTTTTTTPAPQDEGDYGDYPEEEVEASSEAPVSSTEGKKLVSSGVRPFRSNTDLFEALKKRRKQVMDDKNRSYSNSDSAAEPVEPASTKSNYNNKKRTNAVAPKESLAEEQAPSKPSRGRFGRPATRSIQPEELPAAPPVPSSVSAGGQPADGRHSRYGRRPAH